MEKMQDKLDSLEPSQRLSISFDKIGAIWRAIKENQKYFPHLIGVLVRKNTEPFHKSWAKSPAKQKAKIEPSVKNWKNELSEHFKLNGEDENNFGLLRARRYVPPNMTEEVWNKCIDYFSCEEFMSTPPYFDETLIVDEVVDEVLGVRRGYRRGVSLKL
ncbi:hypothetical protein PanWU01x14_223400 [Parasponia andersonii]|uniref:Uncharacterized protein n=1 Tax=Parasponia andersonii TaxID=3476 RepID=A0A2P5BNV5_PARAD|nr:hypothetical protein PanWU01x14_223400 [Parasponia andersonii]